MNFKDYKKRVKDSWEDGMIYHFHKWLSKKTKPKEKKQ